MQKAEYNYNVMIRCDSVNVFTIKTKSFSLYAY